VEYYFFFSSNVYKEIGWGPNYRQMLQVVFLLSVLKICEAPRLFPESPNSSYSLIHAEILLRHGARTPIVQFLPRSHRGIWQCDSTEAEASRIEAVPLVHPRRVRRIQDQRTSEFPPNCQVGDLTVEGMNEHKLLGEAFRKYLVDELHFLPEYVDPTLITARATWFERTYRSCLSFLYGLYPPATMNEVIDIVVGSQTWDVVHPMSSMCSDLDSLQKEYYNTPDFVAAHKKVLEIAEPLYTYTNTSNKTPKGTEQICDWAITNWCNEQRLPSEITETIINECKRFQSYFFYKINFLRGSIGAAPILREMFRLLDDSMGGSSTAKLNILSAHDSVIAYVLSALGYSEEYGPPYASHITMQVYMKDQEPYVRFAFNGKLIPLKNQETIIPLHQLREMLDPTLGACPELP